MRSWKRFLLWIWLLQKRLWKKTSFLIVLAIVPIAVLLLRYFVSGQEHSILSIALVQERDDTVALEKVFQKLEVSDVIAYEMMTEEAAMEALEAGELDAVWVIPEDLSGSIRNMIQKGWKEKNAIIEVRQREDDVFLQMSRMQLYGSLFEDISYELFYDYMIEELQVGDSISEAEMIALYQENHVEGELFRYSYATEDGQETTAMDILMTPIRGFLTIWLMLCGIVAALYWKNDLKRGTFDWISELRKPVIGIGCQILVVLNGAFVVWLAILISGLGQGLGWEALITLLYAANVVLFCNALSQCIPNSSWYATFGGLLLLVISVVCPLFFRVNGFTTLSMLFPPQYYVRSIHNPDMAWKGVWYLLILVVCNVVLMEVKSRKRQ